MSIIIKLQGLPLDATSVDVRRYFLGLTIPEGGVHIVGGDDGTVFIEFASDEDARQAMARGDGNIKNSNVKLLLSSRTEMQTVTDTARQKQQQYLQQQQQQQQLQQIHLQQQQQMQNQQQQQQQHHPTANAQAPVQTQQSAFVDPRILSQSYQEMMSASAALNQVQQQQHHHHQQQQQHLAPPPPQPTLLPQNQIFTQFPPTTVATSNTGNLNMNLLSNLGLVGTNVGGPVNGFNPSILMGNNGGLGGGVGGLVGTLPTLPPNLLDGSATINSSIDNSNLLIGNTNDNNNSGNNSSNRNHSPDNRARMSGMRGGDDKLFANKRCVLAASNIPYRATSKDIIEFLSEFNIKEDCIRRRYNQKGQPTADAKIAFPTPDAAMKALKMMNKKTLCGRPVFLKPV